MILDGWCVAAVVFTDNRSQGKLLAFNLIRAQLLLVITVISVKFVWWSMPSIFPC